MRKTNLGLLGNFNTGWDEVLIKLEIELVEPDYPARGYSAMLVHASLLIAIIRESKRNTNFANPDPIPIRNAKLINLNRNELNNLIKLTEKINKIQIFISRWDFNLILSMQKYAHTYGCLFILIKEYLSKKI